MSEIQYHYCPVCGSAYPENVVDSTAHECSQCGFILYENQSATASAVIIENGQLLLVKRALEPRKGCWDFAGGYIELTESPEAAVVREVKEELGVESQVIRLFNVYGATKYVYQNKTRYNCDIYYLVKLLDHNLQPADDAAEYRWFPLDKLPEPEQIAFPAQLQLIAEIKNDPNLTQV